MHGMCCHSPNTIRSWSNILNYLKALEYKVRKDYCVNNNNKKKSKRSTGKEKPKEVKITSKSKHFVRYSFKLRMSL